MISVTIYCAKFIPKKKLSKVKKGKKKCGREKHKKNDFFEANANFTKDKSLKTSACVRVYVHHWKAIYFCI